MHAVQIAAVLIRFFSGVIIGVCVASIVLRVVDIVKAHKRRRLDMVENQQRFVGLQYVIAAGGGAGYPFDVLRKWEPGKLQIAGAPPDFIKATYRDAEGRFHREDGMAIETKDGGGYWFWHGLQTDADTILAPQCIMRQQIDYYGINRDQGRVAVERYIGRDPHAGLTGPQRYIRDSIEAGTYVDIHCDQRFGRLIAAPMGRPIADCVVMAVVKNSTPEPDGSYRTEYIRVPPTMKTVREALAWSFRLSAEEYDPVIET